MKTCIECGAPRWQAPSGKIYPRCHECQKRYGKEAARKRRGKQPVIEPTATTVMASEPVATVEVAKCHCLYREIVELIRGGHPEVDELLKLKQRERELVAAITKRDE